MNYIVAFIFKLFRLPAVPQMLLAIPAFAMAFWSFGLSSERQRALAVALETPAPEVIDIKDFDRSAPLPFADEINLVVRIDTKFNTTLTQSRNGITTAKRTMFAVFDKDDPLTETKARGVILFHPDDVETFFQWSLGRTNRLAEFELQGQAGYEDRRPVVMTLNGSKSTSQGVGSVIDKAFREYGLTRHSEFIHIEPFFNGRAAGLKQSVSYLGTWIGVGFGLLFLGLGASRMIQGQRPAMAQSPRAPSQPTPAAPAPKSRVSQGFRSMPEGSTNNVKDGPLARILEREAQDEAAYQSAIEAEKQSKAKPKRAKAKGSPAQFGGSGQPLKRYQMLAGIFVGLVVLVWILKNWFENLPPTILVVLLVGLFLVIRKFWKQNAGLILPPKASSKPQGLAPFTGKIDHDPFENVPKITVPDRRADRRVQRSAFEDHLDRKGR